MSIEENVLQNVGDREKDSEPRPGAPHRVAQLSVVLGLDEGKTFRFDESCVIGRAGDATVRLADRGVSMHHARVRRLSDDRFVLEDLSSKNGTLLNGNQVELAPLEAGARIQIGPRCLLLFSLHDELQQSLIQAKKVEIIGRLSAGLNHDFNNLLCVILANAAYLLELPGDMHLGDGDVRECLEDMRSAAQSGSEVTNRLSTLAQSSTMAQESVDFSGLCEETLEVLRDTFPKSIRIVGLIQPGIRVRGVRSHLRQLMWNPCLNARDAMPEGGILTLEALVKPGEEFAIEPMLKADSYLVITFTDTGRGMASEVLASAFEPFFTTKELELGKGLGLSAVRKVASDHGGTAELSSRPHAGTRLRVVLPVTDTEASLSDALEEEARPESARPGQPSSRPEGHGIDSLVRPISEPVRRRVLMAEEDEGLGRAFIRCLKREGYEVTWVTEVAEALRLFRAPDEVFDVVLLDVEAPELARHGGSSAFRNRDPELPIVVFSGDSRDSEGAAPPGFDTVVRKPVDPSMLARIVSASLRRSAKTLRT
jgi:signal transduction histidine kinase/CheY-like chemotaxis protein